jgi:hypothetical protein
MTRIATVTVVLGLAALIGGAATTASRGGRQPPTSLPTFLTVGHCYRIAFPIDGAPNYKVLELVGEGWIRAEVDAGSARAQRQSFWIDTAQIVTMRETRCSE